MSATFLELYDFCACGCDSLAAPGTRFAHGHNRRSGLHNYEINDAGCWMWQGSETTQGYGRVKFEGVEYLAHRWHYVNAKGPIPEGLQIDHLCRVKMCVNPDHLEAVTPRENVLRGVGFTAVNAAKTHCIRGHEFAGDNLLISGGKRRCRACARLYESAA